MQRVLRGPALVPTEAELARREKRDYETATELLARVRANANNSPKPRRTRARTAGS